MLYDMYVTTTSFLSYHYYQVGPTYKPFRCFNYRYESKFQVNRK